MKNTSNTIEIYKARTIGTLFILAFFAYGLGRYFLSNDVIEKKYIGAILIIY